MYTRKVDLDRWIKRRREHWAGVMRADEMEYEWRIELARIKKKYKLTNDRLAQLEKFMVANSIGNYEVAWEMMKNATEKKNRRA